MTALNFPDSNVWLALASPEHVHAAAARRWWTEENGRIAFLRFTQAGFLRLMTSSAAMDGKPLSMVQAWAVYDRFFEDDRVAFLAEPLKAEMLFREYATGKSVSPRIWADAWLLAYARASAGTLVTFDRALGMRGARCILDERSH